MKRIHAIIITLALALLLTACGDSKTTPTASNNSATKAPNSPTSSANNDPTTPTSKPTDPVADTPTPEPENSPTPAVLESGLYNDQNELKKTWEELISSEKIKVEDGMLTYADKNLIGLLVIDDSVTALKSDSAVFEGSVLFKVNLPKKLMVIPPKTFKNSNITDITMPDQLVEIGNEAFSGCKNLTTVVLPDSVTVIGNSAFWECINLESITLSSSLCDLGQAAFYYCSALKEVVLPEGVKQIKDCTFGQCKSLTQLTIPSSVELIGYIFEKAFIQKTRRRELPDSIRVIVYPNDKRESVAFVDGFTDNEKKHFTFVVVEDSLEHAYCIKNNLQYELMK